MTHFASKTFSFLIVVSLAAVPSTAFAKKKERKLKPATMLNGVDAAAGLAPTSGATATGTTAGAESRPTSQATSQTFRSQSHAKSKHKKTPAPVATLVSPMRETSIGTLAVALFNSRVSDKNQTQLWENLREEFQKAFVTRLNQISAIESVPLRSDYNLDSTRELIRFDTEKAGADAALVGEYQGRAIELTIVTEPSGRHLLQFSVPARDISAQNVAEQAVNAADALLGSLRYQGYIVVAKGKDVKMNVGAKVGLVKGQHLTIFDFRGPNPTLTSPIDKIGELELTKVTPKASEGRIISMSRPIVPYYKVAATSTTTSEGAAAGAPAAAKAAADSHLAFNNQATTAQTLKPVPSPRPAAVPLAAKTATGSETISEQKSGTKSEISSEPKRSDDEPLRPGFWFAAGPEYISLNTTVADGNPLYQQRAYSIPGSLAVGLGFGYSRLSFWARVSGASNTSNSVTIVQSSATYDVYSFGSRHFSGHTLGGIYFAQYSATPTPTAVDLLTNVTTTSGLVEEEFKLALSPKMDLALTPTIYFPVFASDSINGSSTPTSSFGAGGTLALRSWLSKSVAVDTGLNGHVINIQNSNGFSSTETQFGAFGTFVFML